MGRCKKIPTKLIKGEKMKKCLLVTSILLATHVSLADTPYFRVGMGISTPPDSDVKFVSAELPGLVLLSDVEFDSEIGFNFAFGIENFNGVKIECMFSSQENDATLDDLFDADLNTRTFGVNFVKELGGIDLNPFVNAGTGFVFSEFEDDTTTLKDTSVYFNLGAGVSFALSNTMDFYGSYNYYFIGDPEDTFVDDGIIYEAELELGLHQFAFGIAGSF